MPINPQITARVDPNVRDRIDRCVDAANEANPAHPIDRGGMVRVLLLSALPAQEAAYGLDAQARAKKTTPKKKRISPTPHRRGST